MATNLGLNLTGAPMVQAAGVTGRSIEIRYAHVLLEIQDSSNQFMWRSVVAFAGKEFKCQYPLLGISGFLQFFDAKFHGKRELVELEPIR